MNFATHTAPRRSAIFSSGFIRSIQYLCLAGLIVSVAIHTAEAADMQPGRVYSLMFTDVDQRQLSTSDGHITIITVVTRKDEQKAQAVGDRFPHVYLGNPMYRLVTVVNFQQKLFSPFRGLVHAIIRSRLEEQAKELQEIYHEKRLNRGPRSDLFVVADFDGKAVSQLGIAPASDEFAIFAFDGRGQLLKRWDDVPSAEVLMATMRDAR